MRKKGNRTRRRSYPKRVILFWTVNLLLLISISFSAKLYLGLRKSPFWSLARKTFVLVTEKQLLVFSFQDNEGLILNLPKDEKVPLTRDFGEYEWGKIYRLSKLEGMDGLLLEEAVQKNLRVPVFGYFYDPSEFDYSKLKGKSFFGLILWRALKGEVETDLNNFDLAILYLKSKKLSDTEIRMKDFGGRLESSFKDTDLRKESYALEILNSTEHLGLAQEVAELLENAGGRVIRLADTDQVEENCLLLPKDKVEESYTLFWLGVVFDCRVEKAEKTETRAEITLIIGEKYWKNLNEK